MSTNSNQVDGIDNPQVQGIIVAISKGGSDKYGVSNPQGAKGKINIQVLSALIRLYVHRTFASNKKRERKLCCGYEEDNFA